MIIINQEENPKNAKLQQLDEIINCKSKNSVPIDGRRILYPRR